MPTTKQECGALGHPPLPRRLNSANVLVALAISYTGMAATLASTIVLARGLGRSGKGEFSLFQLTIAGVAALAGFGVGQGQMFCAIKDPDKFAHSCQTLVLYRL